MGQDVQKEVHTFDGRFEMWIIKMTGTQRRKWSLSPVVHLVSPDLTDHVKMVFRIT